MSHCMWNFQMKSHSIKIQKNKPANKNSKEKPASKTEIQQSPSHPLRLPELLQLIQPWANIFRPKNSLHQECWKVWCSCLRGRKEDRHPTLKPPPAVPPVSDCIMKVRSKTITFIGFASSEDGQKHWFVGKLNSLTWKPKVRSYAAGCNWKASANDYSFHVTAKVLLELLICCAAWGKKKNLFHPLLILSSSDTTKTHHQAFAYFEKNRLESHHKSQSLCV